MSKKVVIVGGHGKQYPVTSIIRTEDHIPDITSISPFVTPLILSLEQSPVSAFTEAFSGADTVVFTAGAGGKGGPDRTRTVDYEGALKVYDALEAVPDRKPHLLLVSSIDVRDPDRVPLHYDEADRATSVQVRKVISNYFHWKYQADKNLVLRTAFPWTIIRPTGLTDQPGTGRADIGRTHVTSFITRDDVAQILAELVERPDAAGLAIDITSGDVPIAEGLDKFIKNGETDWLG
ncbi:NAD(P)-binding protein [Multifurca ochricompacta]|uniref:NAD(P)-binding protein n=1 Tax=Multifurca ochricompacta TaxID=376703 RepID=A0AAD4M1N8_9AGAM|nr:NAD(P)-binding protein [Multifurca ochricompacta]